MLSTKFFASGRAGFPERLVCCGGSLEAGTNNALFYTLLANCRAQGIDPEAYLIEVIKRLPHDADDAQAAALTPARIAEENRAARESA